MIRGFIDAVLSFLLGAVIIGSIVLLALAGHGDFGEFWQTVSGFIIIGGFFSLFSWGVGAMLREK